MNRKPKKIDRDEEQWAAAWVATIMIVGAVVTFFLGYAVDMPGASSICYIAGFLMLVVALAATHVAVGDEEE